MLRRGPLLGKLSTRAGARPVSRRLPSRAQARPSCAVAWISAEPPTGPRTAPDLLVQRLFQNTIGALEMYAVYLGDQLGYYRAMAGGDWLTADELAERTGTDARYGEEWLSHQAVREIVDVEDLQAQPRRCPAGRRAGLRRIGRCS
ncbi:hypothetical protein ACIA5D_12200 [Actinoplanes sp. NPDC051513]|uniref:hypothetical protein n=1 Tax=Actinoplanes sp. NPDC051513 TaxID=3363908 RepID=UPI003791BFDD